MVKIGRALTMYIIMCTLTTAFFMVACSIKNKFKPKEPNAKEEEEYKASVDEALSIIRMVFGDMDDGSIVLLCLVLDTYIPGLNFMVWKGLLFDLIGLEAKS